MVGCTWSGVERSKKGFGGVMWSVVEWAEVNWNEVNWGGVGWIGEE